MEMNQLCKVCGEPAAGFHFGAFTCEGCKSFFGRTYNNLSSLSECKNSGRCIINKKNRTSCKSCRLRKCLMVGMSKSGSRYGRRSNWFKIHCLLQDQANMNGQLEGALANGEMASQKCGMYDHPSSRGGGVGVVGVDCKDDELMMTGSPADSHSDSCGEMDSIKPLNGCYDPSNNNNNNNNNKSSKAKSGSLSPLSSYESPSPPYDKATKDSTTSSSGYLHPLPMSPLSPISPLVAFQQQQKFFGQVAAAGLLPNGFGGLAGLHHHHHHHGPLGVAGSSPGANPLTFRPYAPLSNFDLLLKKRKAFVFDLANSCNSVTSSISHHSSSTNTNNGISSSGGGGGGGGGGSSEQEVPIDLSLKRTGAETVSEESKSSRRKKKNNEDDDDDDDDFDDDDEDYDDDDGDASGKDEQRRARQVESPLDLTKRS